MDKKISIQLQPLVVPNDVTPMEYRLSIVGPEVISPVAFPYGADASVIMTFTVDGDYVATARLHDVNGVLLGSEASASFTILNAPTTKEINVVSSVTVNDV